MARERELKAKIGTSIGQRLALAGLATVFMTGLAGPARADVTMSIVAVDTSLTAGAQSEISLVLTQSVPIRSFEVRLAYDRGVIESSSGSTGSLFSGNPCYVMDGFDDSTSGTVHAYAVIIGSTCSASGPGELFRWTYRAVHPGHTAVSVSAVALYDPGGYPIAVATIEPASINVREQVGVTDGHTWGTLKSLFR